VSAGRAARGFTLLEAMVAMAILALSLTAAFEVVGGAMQNHMRARRLETATFLARGKLVEVEAKYEEDGFRDFDQAEDGTFDEAGHPEIRWEVKITKPAVALGAEGVLKALTGVEGGLDGLLGLAGGGAAGKDGGAGGPAAALAASPMAAAAKGMIEQQLTALGEEMKKGVRQVRLTVAWKDGKADESFSLVTYMVVLVPGSQRVEAAPMAAPIPGLPAAAPGLPPPASGFTPPGRRTPQPGGLQ
jgi:general secretion pathway protein I